MEDIISYKTPFIKMFITKQILNEKQKKSMMPHTRQIFSQIQASIDDQQFKINRYSNFGSIKRQSTKLTRPKTAASVKTYKTINTEQSQKNSFVKKINYQIDEIQQISSLFDRFFDLKKEKQKTEKIILSKNVMDIRKKISQKQNQQVKKSQITKYFRSKRYNNNQGNMFVGYPKEKIRNIISASKAKNEDLNILTRCIKGGYIQDHEEFCDTINKSEFLKLKKKFITLDAVYHCVKGRRNQGIRELKPEKIDNNSLVNVIYYLENQKNFKMTDKIAIQEKIKFVE